MVGPGNTGKSQWKSLSGSQYSFLFGGITSGKTVNERTDMQTTAVYACVRVIGEAMASLPLHVYKKDRTRQRKSNKPSCIIFSMTSQTPR